MKNRHDATNGGELEASCDCGTRGKLRRSHSHGIFCYGTVQSNPATESCAKGIKMAGHPHRSVFIQGKSEGSPRSAFMFLETDNADLLSLDSIAGTKRGLLGGKQTDGFSKAILNFYDCHRFASENEGLMYIYLILNFRYYELIDISQTDNFQVNLVLW